MKRFVNGDEVELQTGFEVTSAGDRLIVKTERGAETAVAVKVGDLLFVSFRGQVFEVRERQVKARSVTFTSSKELRAPMPGQIIAVLHREGSEVLSGATVIVLEAMKTQQPLRAPYDGVVTRIEAKVGDQVTDGQLLAIIEPSGKPIA